MSDQGQRSLIEQYPAAAYSSQSDHRTSAGMEPLSHTCMKYGSTLRVLHDFVTTRYEASCFQTNESRPKIKPRFLGFNSDAAADMNGDEEKMYGQ
jgi:hypothetical protein